MSKYLTALSLLAETLIEHNIFAVSKLYKYIKMKYLIYLWKIEKIARRMVSEERIKGCLIDNIGGFIYFRCCKFYVCAIPVFSNLFVCTLY